MRRHTLLAPLFTATAQRLASGTVWSLIGTVASQAFGLLASVIAARMLGKELFGRLGIVQSTLGMLGLFAGLGLGLTTTKYVAEFRRRDRDRAGGIIGFGLSVTVAVSACVAVIMIVIAPALACDTLRDPALAVQLRIATILLIFNAVAGTQAGVLAGLEAFRDLTLINVIRGVSTLLLGYAGIVLGGLAGAICGLGAASIAVCIISHVRIQSRCRAERIKITIAKRETEVLWRFSIPAFLSWTASIPAQWLVCTFLVNEPHGYSEMAVFNAANQWRALYLLVPSVLGQVVIPIMSSSYNTRDVRTTKRVLAATVIVCAVVCLPIFIVTLFASNHVMTLYGRGFARHGTTLCWISVAAILSAVQTPVGHLIAASGNMWMGAFMNLSWAIVLVTSAYVAMMWRAGADGLAVSYVIAYVAHCAWTIYYGRRLLNPRFSPVSMAETCA